MDMNLIRLLVIVALIVTFLLPQFAMAYQPVLVAKLDEPTLSLKRASLSLQEKGAADGSLAGEVMAESLPTGGKLGLGVLIGFLTGVIGTGIGYSVIDPESMTPEVFERYNEGNSDYKIGFKLGWDKKTQSKKRMAFLVGGVLGTAATLMLIDPHPFVGIFGMSLFLAYPVAVIAF